MIQAIPTFSWLQTDCRGHFLKMVVLACSIMAVLSCARAAADELKDTTAGAVIALEPGEGSDNKIARRIESIFAQIDSLEAVTVSVDQSVVRLAGEVPNEAAAGRAVELASRMEGAIAVEDGITRTLDLEGNLNPLLASMHDKLRNWIRALPLLLTALAIFGLVAFAAHQLANRTSLWSRVTPNPFLMQLITQAIRIAGIVLGLVLALNVLGASALLGTILGSAGVLGLAISFAVKDSMENYISSIMLSIRQPFRASDHVVIDSYEGIVMRLTSRSTVLMTLDGNHLRVPNSTVYKSVITNYTRNPQRRFDFVLGVDADGDPADAMSVGLAAVAGLSWVLQDPPPSVVIETVGDSNILIRFMAWIDQREANYGKARSLAIRAAKHALEAEGFTLPEPIYRLRFDNAQATNLVEPGAEKEADANVVNSARTGEAAAPRTGREEADWLATPAVDQDVAPETHLEERVEAERELTGDDDLLDESRPVE